MINVQLTWQEFYNAGQIGYQRQFESLKRSLPDAHGFDGQGGWDVHVVGAQGECAVAKALGRYWSGSVNTFKLGDDVHGLQVRTRRKHWYELLVRPVDDPDAIFVLATVENSPRDFRIHGWLVGADAQQDKYLQAPDGKRPPCYIVPHRDLLPLEDLLSGSVPFMTT